MTSSFKLCMRIAHPSEMGADSLRSLRSISKLDYFNHRSSKFSKYFTQCEIFSGVVVGLIELDAKILDSIMAASVMVEVDWDVVFEIVIFTSSDNQTVKVFPRTLRMAAECDFEIDVSYFRTK